MSKKYMRRKRKISLILIIILTAGIVLPLFGSRGLVVRAAGEEPSLSYFATKEQLMNSFDISEKDFDKQKQGFINFGKYKDVPAGGSAEYFYTCPWIIVGKDEGSEKDNVILYAAASLDLGYFWETEDSVDHPAPDKKNYENYENITYESGTAPSEVYMNHYGTSDLRKKLIEIQKDSRYFTASEQALMLPSAISNTDTLNKRAYTVEDKLYAPGAVADSSDSYLLFGSKGRMLKAYPLGDGNFQFSYSWTRSPDTGIYGMPGNVYVLKEASRNKFEISDERVCRIIEGYQPAVDLDLTNVLFASSVPIAKSVDGKELTALDAMNLRMDGKDSKFPGASLSSTDDKISYSGVPGGAYLVVQGKTQGNKDWYYRTSASGTGSLRWADISVTSNLPDQSVDIGESSFSKCKIWLETTDASDGFTYAISGKNESEPEENKEITSVKITDIEKPDPEQVFDISAVCDTEGLANHTPSVKWYEEDGKTEVTRTNPEYEKKYVASVELNAASGYTFAEADKMAATVNGENAKISVSADKKTATVTYEFEVGPNLPRIRFDVDAFQGRYDGLPHSLTVSLNTSADVTISYGERGSDGKVDYTKFGSNPPEYIKAGKYPVYIKLESDGYAPVEDYEATITISPRPITIALEDQEVVWRKNLPVARDKYKITKGELASGDKIADVNITVGPNNLKAGETGWIALFNGDVKIRNDEGEDVSDCYLITNERGKLTVLHNASLPPLDITVDKTKKEYKVGEELNVDDLKVTVRYEDGYTEEVAGFTTNAEDIDMSTPGEKTLVVTYQGEDNEITIRVVSESDSKDDGGDDKKTDGDDKKDKDDTKKDNSSGSGTKDNSDGSGSKSGSSGKTSGTGIGGLISAVQTGDASPVMLSILAVIGSELTAIGVLSFKTFKSGRKKKG